MDLKQIQYFIALFEDGSVTRAAKRLNIVQPALSMQIAKLEDELKQTLFERGAHGMTPTAAGRLMYRLYLPIMRDLKQAQTQLMQRDEVVSGHVSLGLIASVSESVLADALSRFHEQYPHVEVTVADGYSATFIDLVTGGQLEAALINRPRARLSLDSEPLLDEEMVLATGVNGGPTLPPVIELAQVQELDLVLPTKRHGFARRARRGRAIRRRASGAPFRDRCSERHRQARRKHGVRHDPSSHRGRTFGAARHHARASDPCAANRAAHRANQSPSPSDKCCYGSANSDHCRRTTEGIGRRIRPCRFLTTTPTG